MVVISINLNQEILDWLEEQTNNKSAFIEKTLWMRKRGNSKLTKGAIEEHWREIKKHIEKIEKLKEESKKEIKQKKEEKKFFMEKRKEFIKDFESSYKVKKLIERYEELLGKYGSRKELLNYNNGQVYLDFIKKWGNKLDVGKGMIDKYLKYKSEIEGENE